MRGYADRSIDFLVWIISFLKTGDASANFNSFGNRPSLRQLLIIFVSNLVYTRKLSFKIFAGMSHFLVAFLVDRFINSFLTSFTMT